MNFPKAYEEYLGIKQQMEIVKVSCNFWEVELIHVFESKPPSFPYQLINRGDWSN